jgi:hypothetical protein
LRLCSRFLILTPAFILQKSEYVILFCRFLGTLEDLRLKRQESAEHHACLLCTISSMPASPLVLCDWAVSCLLAPFETGQVISLLLETGGQKSQDLNAPASTCLYLLKTHPKTDARGHHVLIMQTHRRIFLHGRSQIGRQANASTYRPDLFSSTDGDQCTKTGAL